MRLKVQLYRYDAYYSRVLCALVLSNKKKKKKKKKKNMGLVTLPDNRAISI